ncbi:enoyl-CoA hydratase-related protein [Acidocella facilis]|uniref:enoyl-CoA hydratase-related protein n=1 Tax=Acidocella facilis TaxID=525 RepID=UPI001F19D8E4|nr:enoyl-CoA hydratase-related protein [Acidocella facilis]
MRDQRVKTVTSQCDGRVATLIIDRPERRNALNQQVKSELIVALEAAIQDDAVSAIILTGANGVFAAGSDIAEMATLTAADQEVADGGKVFSVLRNCPKPVIAAVEGYALGGGCELALSCDLIIAGENAKFAQPEIRVGIMPGGGGSQHLLRAIGRYQAAWMVLTGEAVDAKTAFVMGMVSELAGEGGALEAARKRAVQISKLPPLAVRAAKSALRKGEDLLLAEALRAERQAFIALFDTADQKEGMAAFLEKRSPNYRGF